MSPGVAVVASEGVSAGSPEAVYLLAASADGRWVAAVSGDWVIHVYDLKCFKVGARGKGFCRSDPTALLPWAVVGSTCRTHPQRRAGGGCQGSWGVRGGPGCSISSVLLPRSITARCPRTAARCRPSPSTPSPTTSSSPTRTSRWEPPAATALAPSPRVTALGRHRDPAGLRHLQQEPVPTQRPQPAWRWSCPVPAWG